MWGQSVRRGPGRIWVGAAAVALATSAFVAYDVGGAPESPRAAAFAEPVRNATVVIEEGGARKGFSTPAVTVSGGGTVTVVNLDSMDHTVTSVAKGADGLPLFDVRVAAGTTATVPGVESLAAGEFAFYCKFHPGMRGVLTVTGAGGGVEPERPTFDQPLVVPPTERGADIRLVMRRARVRTLPEGRRTSMWTFDGTYPGPTIRRRGGQGTHVTVVNRLPKGAGSTSTHLHGDHHAAKDDGQPTTQLVRRGDSRTYDYPLTVDGRATPGSFFWYHDHRMDRTARNNWRGLQGMFIVTDPPMPGVRLPSGSRDVPLMISERSFTPGNQLTDPFADGPEMVHGSGHDEMSWAGDHAPPNDATVGDTVLVNGRAAPYLDVSATRYRLRLLNSSPFSSYNLTLSDGRPILQIGTGSGLLPRAVVRSSVLLGPAQRADVIVDFSGATGQADRARVGARGDRQHRRRRPPDRGDGAARRRSCEGPVTAPVATPLPRARLARADEGREDLDLRPRRGGPPPATTAARGPSTASRSTRRASTTAPGSAPSSAGASATPATSPTTSTSTPSSGAPCCATARRPRRGSGASRTPGGSSPARWSRWPPASPTTPAPS